MELKLREKILHIMNMTLMLNGDNGAHVFCEFCGHIKAVEVRVYNHGWGVDIKPDFRSTAYITDSDAIDKLNTIIECLEALAKENHINVAL